MLKTHLKHILGLLILISTTPLQAQTTNVDFNNNGAVDFPDFLAFVQAFGSTQTAFDLNGNGTVDFPDFLMFTEAFRQSGGTVEPEKEVTANLPGGRMMAFTYIEPGTFIMGSDRGGEFNQDEHPKHEVTLTQGFYMGTYEVTQAQWETVMQTTPWKGQRFITENTQHPAAYISWYDAHDFIHQLNTAANDSLYRLPTEAEWEYACRAGTTTAYFWGNDESQQEAYTHPGSFDQLHASVGSKLPNPWGLYDMSGNAWEWCQDKHGDYPSEPQTDPLDLTLSTVNRVARFGLPSSDRVDSFPGRITHVQGFRLVRIVK